jgi:hypothetical protein
MCRQHETLETAENFTSRYQTRLTEVVKDMCDNRMGIYFLTDIRGWAIKFLTFNGRISNIFVMKTFLFGATPRHK